MAKVLVVRHGETIENEQGICQGQTDGTLSPKGIRQNMELANRLKHHPFQAIITSPLGRAYETATTVALNHPTLTLCSDNRLMERNMGLLQGNPFPTNYSDETVAECMEPWVAFHERVRSFIETLQSEYQEKTVLIITHGLVMRMMVLVLNRLPIERLTSIPLVENASCLEFEI